MSPDRAPESTRATGSLACPRASAGPRPQGTRRCGSWVRSRRLFCWANGCLVRHRSAEVGCRFAYGSDRLAASPSVSANRHPARRWGLVLVGFERALGRCPVCPHAEKRASRWAARPRCRCSSTRQPVEASGPLAFLRAALRSQLIGEARGERESTVTIVRRGACGIAVTRAWVDRNAGGFR
jgi:hypothetical protein